MREELLDDALAGRWEELLKVRDIALKRLEEARQAKLIGNSLEAVAEIQAFSPSLEAVAEVKAFPPLLDLLNRHQEDLEAIFMVSGVRITYISDRIVYGVDPELEVRVQRAPGRKCERCWNFRESVGEDSKHPTICRRCVDALAEAGPR